MKSKVEASVLVAGSANITGMNLVFALEGRVEKLAGYDCCPILDNASHFVCGTETVPRVVDSGYSDAVIDIVKRRKVTHIIASNDHDVRFLHPMENKLRELGVEVNAINVRTLPFLNKLETSRLFSENGIKTPKVFDYDTVEIPFVVRKNHLGGSKKYTYVVRSEEELPPRHLKAEDSIYTKLIEGDEFTIDVLANKGASIAVVPRLRKTVMAPGIVWNSEIVKDDVMIDDVRRIVGSLKLDGMYCIQCIRNEEGNHFFEVNPRPGSGIDLTTHAGINMPLLWLSLKKGEHIDPVEPRWGAKMVRYYSAFYY